MVQRLGLGAGVALCGLLAGLSGAAQAESLREALVKAYRTNPNITGQRAALRATDENVVVAKSAGRPRLGADGTFSETLVEEQGAVGRPRRSVSAGVSASMPLYSGGEVRNSIRAAEARVLAGRSDLRSVESQIFVQATAAYLDVIRDEAIVSLNELNVRVLETNLTASRDRFEVGDLTRTDVAQSEARLATAKSGLQSARAQLDVSRENYLEVIGTFPTTLEAPPPLPGLPGTANESVTVALDNNPQLAGARERSRAASFDIGVARSLALPRLSAFASGDYFNALNSTDTTGLGPNVGIRNSTRSAAAGLSLSVPLYQGGLPSARVRQAQALSSQALEQVTATERAIVADARSAYAQYQAALAVIASSQTAVEANELALEGVRAENSVGTRDILDVLNAEQELLNSRVQLVSAQRDAYVTGFALLAAMGRAEAQDLNLDGGALYDPEVNYRRVRNSLSDWDSDPTPRPIAPRTADLPLPEPVAATPIPATSGTPTPVSNPAAPLPAQSTPAQLNSPQADGRRP